MIEARLTLPADGAFALTARLFVASILRILGTDDGSVEDIKLAVSELCGAAAAAELPMPIEIRVTDQGGGAVVEFEGITTLEAAEAAHDETEEFARAYRLPLLQSLFPQMQMVDGIVRIAISAR
ncbi:MAG TPA: hypothetical protein VGR41_09855 [Actinomycetota bacterium]|jgi:anti-sigma regulatory factor (Ser/Thr protein kinase)|nr:hypothetical protein [Actinomycetota bacterium]